MGHKALWQSVVSACVPVCVCVCVCACARARVSVLYHHRSFSLLLLCAPTFFIPPKGGGPWLDGWAGGRGGLVDWPRAPFRPP